MKSSLVSHYQPTSAVLTDADPVFYRIPGLLQQLPAAKPENFGTCENRAILQRLQRGRLPIEWERIGVLIVNYGLDGPKEGSHKDEILDKDGHGMSLKSADGMSQPVSAAAIPPFRRVQNLFLWIAVAVCTVIVVDNVSFKPMTGSSIKDGDYVFLGLAGAFLILAVLRRDLGRKVAVPVVAVLFVLALIEGGLGLWSLTRARRWPWYVWPPNYSCRLTPANPAGVRARDLLADDPIDSQLILPKARQFGGGFAGGPFQHQ